MRGEAQVDGRPVAHRDREGEPPLERGTLVGRYVVLERIGVGGMSEVYAAYDPELDRRVAVKLLRTRHRSPGRRAAAQQRLRREAQALARLDHPNVLTVHDVGVFGERLFLAGELVPGVSLRVWLAARPRSLGELLGVFRQAGEGLAAAHRAGLVHRDFNPGNVMVRDDGRVQVLDFGLVRGDGSGEAGEGQTVSLEELGELAEPPSPNALEEPLTRTGAALGTPAYVAPEQLRGEPAGFAADQFSFCVSLYEALFGVHPFAGGGERGPELADRTLRAPSAPRRLPARIRRALLRGLALEPETRHPSMQALVAELAHEPRARRRRAALAAAAAVGLLALALGYRVAPVAAPDPCADAAERLAGVWDEGRRGEVRQALLGSGLPFAPAAWERTERRLDSYRRRWIEASTESCVATRQRGDQSTALFDLRAACLDSRRLELGALVDLLTTAGPELVERAVEAAAALTPIATCGDARALLARAPVPDATTRRAIAAVEARLAAAKARQDAGLYDAGLALAAEAVESAAAIGYWPLDADALLRRGTLEERTGKLDAAAQSLGRALESAVAGGNERSAADALLHLARLHGVLRSDLGEGRRYAEQARSVLHRLDRPEDLEATREDLLGTLANRQGELADALEHHQRALMLRLRVGGPDQPNLANTLVRIGNVLTAQGELDRATTVFARALAVSEAALGPDHPQVAYCLDRLGNAQLARGDSEAAIASHRRALAISRAALPGDHPRLAASWTHLGNALEVAGHHREAVGYYRRALALYETVFGAEHPTVAAVLTSLGVAHYDRGEYAAARELFERSLAIYRKVRGPRHPKVAESLINVADARRRLGDLAVARARYREALDIVVDRLGEGHYLAVDARTGLGEVLLALGDGRGARELLERAVETGETAESDPARRAVTRFALARALAVTGDGGRACTMARQAAEALGAAPPSWRDERAEVERWLKVHEVAATTGEDRPPAAAFHC